MTHGERIGMWKVGYKWHHWFAWRPVRLNDGRWRWLVHLERRAVSDEMALMVGAYGDVWTWEYRAKETET